jgi:hypothetical protein
MDTQAQELERDVFEVPVINPWRRQPTAEQVRYARDLCQSELTAPQRTIDRFPTMSAVEISSLIRSLKTMRAERLRKAPHRRRSAPRTRRR